MLDPNVIAKLGELKSKKFFSTKKTEGYFAPASLTFLLLINVLSIFLALFLLLSDPYRMLGIILLGSSVSGLFLALILDNFLMYIFRISYFQKEQLIVETEKLILLDEIANKLSDNKEK